MIFSPLGQGALTGKYSQGARPSESRASNDAANNWMAAYLEPAELDRVDELRPLAKQLEISLAQLALAWCLRDPGVSSVITGATRAEQIEENCGASGLALPPEVVDRIDEIFPAPQ